MYVPCILYVVFISTNYVQYIYYFDNIYIITTPHVSIHLYHPQPRKYFNLIILKKF